MRNRYIYIIGSRVCSMLAVLGLLGCTSSEATVDRDDPQPPVVSDGRVAVDLALSVSATTGNTRMASGVVNPTTLNIDGWSVLPFMVPSDQDSIRKTDTPAMNALTDFPNYEKHYLISDQKLNIGVNAFLCYAKAKHAGDYSATNHGSLTITGSGLDSKFALTPITKPSPSEVILNYMNSIAGADWSSIPASFDSFINLKSGTPQGLAGSSKNIIAYVNEWLDKSIPDAIKNVIRSDTYVTLDNNNKVTAIVGVTDYPGTFPDGSAVIKWDNTENKFVHETYQKWDGTQYVDEYFPDYAYPAERYFYANSRIYTSANSRQNDYSNEKWSDVLNTYENKGTDNKGDVVASTTRSVAIKNPLSYGVAGMEIHIKASNPMINDYGTKAITLGETTFPLTAVIVGSQVEQNCFFQPANPTLQNEPEYLIYDKQIAAENVHLGTATTEAPNGPCVYTLGLQTKDDVSLKVVLEFQNDSGAAFTSENGVIHPGTKFYMLASVVPPGEHDLKPNTTTEEEYGDIGKRVMTRGHMTVVNLTIGSLRTAYNALPDLSSDKLRLFDVVEAVVHKWQLGQTGEHEVYNW